jgi:hypothetical protein
MSIRAIATTVVLTASSLIALSGAAMAAIPPAHLAPSSITIHRSGVAPEPPGKCDNAPPSPCPPGSR